MVRFRIYQPSQSSKEHTCQVSSRYLDFYSRYRLHHLDKFDIYSTVSISISFSLVAQTTFREAKLLHFVQNVARVKHCDYIFRYKQSYLSSWINQHTECKVWLKSVQQFFYIKRWMQLWNYSMRFHVGIRLNFFLHLY